MARDWLAYAGMRGVIASLRLLPLDTAAHIGARLARFLGPRLNRKRHEIALSNLAVAFPLKSQEERLEICLAHWENMGRVLVESTQIDRIIADPKRLRFKSERLLARYHGKLGAAVGVSLHMGNWELAIWPFVVNGLNPAALYRAQPNRYIDAYLRGQREGLFPGGLFSRSGGASAGEDQQISRALMHYVRGGGRLGIVCDQFHRSGVPVTLFGRMTKAQPIAAMIARRLGARIWMTRCVRVGGSSHFEIELKELRVPRTSDQAQNVRTIMETMYRQFEEWVLEAPEQWMWANRKWPVPAAAETAAAEVPLCLPELTAEAIEAVPDIR